MVLAGDLHLAGGQVLDRVVGAPVAQVHLAGAGTERPRQNLMTQADAEQRQAAFQQLLDHGHGIAAGRRWIAGAVGEEQAVRRMVENLLRGRGRGHDGDTAAERC